MKVSFLERKSYKIYELFCLQSEKGLIISSRLNPNLFKCNDYHLKKFKDHSNQSFHIFAGGAIVADATVHLNVNLIFSCFHFLLLYIKLLPYYITVKLLCFLTLCGTKISVQISRRSTDYRVNFHLFLKKLDVYFLHS